MRELGVGWLEGAVTESQSRGSIREKTNLEEVTFRLKVLSNKRMKASTFFNRRRRRKGGVRPVSCTIW